MLWVVLGSGSDVLGASLLHAASRTNAAQTLDRFTLRSLWRLTFDMRGGRQLAKPDVGRPLDGRVRRRLPPRYYARAAVTTISIFHSGRASCACTVALDGVLPGTTHASQTSFMAP